MRKMIRLAPFALFLIILSPFVLGTSWSSYVLDNSSNPINAANVSAINASNSVYLNSTLTNAAGFFNVSILDATSVRLVTSKTGYQNDTTIALPSLTGDFMLPFNITVIGNLPGNITGIVRDNGNFIANANVSAIQGGVIKGSDITDENGYYIMTDLIDGTYTVKITTDGIIQNITNVVVRPGLETVVNFSVTLTTNATVSSASNISERGIKSGGRLLEGWVCEEWSECLLSGIQKRTCYDKWDRGTTYDKPEEERDCVYVAKAEEKPVIPEVRSLISKSVVVEEKPLIPLGTGIVFIGLLVVIAIWVFVYRFVKIRKE